MISIPVEVGNHDMAINMKFTALKIIDYQSFRSSDLNE